MYVALTFTRYHPISRKCIFYQNFDRPWCKTVSIDFVNDSQQINLYDYVEKRNSLDFIQIHNICRYGNFCNGLKNVFEIAVVNEQLVFESLQFYCTIEKAWNTCSAGTWHKNDVVLTSMGCDDVASTLIRRHFGTKCPLGETCRAAFSDFESMKINRTKTISLILVRNYALLQCIILYELSADYSCQEY